jgi:eukaryotic-like serine/threonine-protein kinase
MIGTKFAHFEITGLLGSGGMGEVYQAKDTRLGRSVAIKILPDAFMHDADRLARFEREARVLAALNHSNIAAIHGLEEFGERKLLVMELVEGETLAERIARAPAPIDELLPIAKQICEALEAAHDKGVTHRDLKPANIKIRPDGHVKLLDFGLAKIFEDPAQAQVSNSPTMMSRSMPGIILGTASYMSPEQARGQQVDRLSDNWAFGCVLYEMLTGKQAFTGDTVTDILGAIVRIDPDWTALPVDTPRSVRLLIRRCLSKDKRLRLQHIGDARVEIEQPLNELPEMQVPIAVASKNGLQWKLAIVAFLLFVITSVPASFYLLRPVPDQPQIRFEIPVPPNTEAASFALSPDGKKLVYVAPRDGKNLLWVRAMDSIAAQALTGTEGALQPFWSPDSRSAGFFADGKLKRIDADGGPARSLANATPAEARGGTWNHDDVIVFAPASASGLFRIPASGGDWVRIRTPDIRSFSLMANISSTSPREPRARAYTWLLWTRL